MKTRENVTPYNGKRQRGAVVITFSIIFLLLITLVTLFTTRSILFEQKVINNQMRSKLAFEAAEFGVSAAYQYISDDPDRDGDGIIDAIFELNSDNVGTVNTSAVGQQRVEVSIRDIDSDPDVILAFEIVAQGFSDDSTATRTITKFVTVIDALPNVPNNPLTAHGTVDVNGSATVHNLEGSSTIWSGGDVDVGSNNSTATYIANPADPAYPSCMDTPMTCSETQTSNKTTIGLDIIEHDSNLANLTAEQMFENFFGMSPKAYRAAMVDIDLSAANGDDFNSAANLAQHKIVWYEGDVDIGKVTVGCKVSVTGNNRCSSANEAPSIVIINGNASLKGSPHFYGIVYVMGDASLSGNSTIHGAVIIGGIAKSTTGSLDIWYNSGLLEGTRENGPLASSAGSWRDF